MAKLAVVAAVVLLASCLSTGQAPTPSAPVQAAPPSANNPSQIDNGTGEIPTFRSQARQVLVTVAVWKHAAKSAEAVPKELLRRIPVLANAYAMPPVARGLSADDFQIFDNGEQQKVNYLEEVDFSWRDVDNQRSFQPQAHGAWGGFTQGEWIAAPTATYTIGYIPAMSQTGDCHTIRVAAGDNEVVVNRTRYCDSDEGNTTAEARRLVTQMENFSKSGKRGSIEISSQPFVFWSSRVLSLMRDKPQPGFGSASASAAATYTYVVVVHDSKAPATVQIATEYELGMKTWDDPCPNKYTAIHVFGVIYNTNGEVAARFGDYYQCRGIHNLSLITFGWDPPSTWGSVAIPSRFNSEVQLRPGDYDVHVVVSDGHKFGQARIPLRVEPLDGQALTISDIALNGILRDASWLLQDAAMVSPEPLVPSPLVSKHAQFIPVPDARIPKKSRLPLYFELYEPLLADRSADVTFRMKVTDLKNGRVVMNTAPTSAAECIIPGNVVIPIALNVDTETLPSGAYKIEVQASDSAGRTTEWRTAKFEIQ